MAEVTRHKSRRREDPAADDVADEHTGRCEPADAARKCGRIALSPIPQYARLLLSRMNERNKPYEGESFALIALGRPVIEIERLDVTTDRQDQPTTDG